MSRAGIGLGGGLAYALLLGSVAAGAISPRDARHRRSVHVDTAPSSIASIGSFTPAAGDARFGASFGRAGLAGNSGFRFTPSLAPGANRRVTVAVRARASTAGQAERIALGSGGAIGPSAYNLGVSLGWKRFAVTSDYAKVDLGPLPGSREGADIALSYAGRRWSTRLALAADRALGDVPRLIDSDRAVSVDLGGSFSINNRLDVTGGVRYKMDKDQLQMFDDNRRDSQAVYVGTAFRF